MTLSRDDLLCPAHSTRLPSGLAWFGVCLRRGAGEELAEEGCGFEAAWRGQGFAEGFDAEGEERGGFAAMGLDGDGGFGFGGGARLGGEGHGNGETGNQGLELGGVGEVGGLEIEAACFEIGEQALDAPALAIAREGGFGLGVGGEDEKLAALKP